MSKFDDIIQQKANEHQAPVPAGAWDNIIKGKKKRRFIFFWWTIGILLCGVPIIAIYNYKKPGNKYELVSIQKEPVPANTTISTEDKAIATQTKPTVPGEKIINVTDTDNTTDFAKHNNIDPANNNEKDQANTDSKKMPAGNNSRDKATIAVNQNIQNKKNINKEDSEKSFAKTRKNTKKEKGNSIVKIQAVEAEAVIENKDKVKNNKEIAVVEANDPSSKEINDKTTADSGEPVITPDSKNIASIAPSTKKDLVVDSVQNKQVPATPVENKKAQAAVNKPAKKHSWFIDLGIAPVFPIQQYDQSTTFSRTQLSNNTLSVFSGKLVSTSIDPSVAYSVSLRRAMNKKLSVGLGLQYLQLKEHVTITGTETNTKYTVVDRLVNSIYGPQLVSDTVETVTEGERKISAVNSYTFLSIPVFVQYDFLQKQSWSLGIIGGTYINVYGKYKNEINENSHAQLTASDLEDNQDGSIGIALYGGFRFGKRIGKRVELFAAPSVTWGLSTQNIKNSLLNKKIQQAGLNIGLSYKLM